jgi:hypothetical protein
MTHFARYDNVGNIIAIGTMPAEMIALQTGNIIAAHADRATQYVADGVLCNYTPAELASKNNMPRGWTWKMPDRIAVDARTDAQRAADRLSEVLDARRIAYPDMTVFADAMYWAARGDGSKLEVYYSAIDAIKAAHPKP